MITKSFFESLEEKRQEKLNKNLNIKAKGVLETSGNA